MDSVSGTTAYLDIHTQRYKHVHKCTYVFMHMHKQAHTCTQHMHTHAWTHIQMHTCIHMHTPTYPHKYTHICLFLLFFKEETWSICNFLQLDLPFLIPIILKSKDLLKPVNYGAGISHFVHFVVGLYPQKR